MKMMTRLRRRGDASRSEHGQPDAVTYVRRQRCDSTRNCVGIEVGLEDRAGSSCASSSYRRVPELTRGSSHISLRFHTQCLYSLAEWCFSLSLGSIGGSKLFHY